MYKKRSQTGNGKPQFLFYPKRKFSTCADATLYVRITYQFVNVEKCLGVQIPFENWDSKHHRINNSNFHQEQVEEAFDEIKQKVMGAFYLLSQNSAEPTLREITDMAFDKKGKKCYSLFGVFNDMLEKMRKSNTKKSQQSNLLKHQSCMRHLQAFVLQEFKVNDISFNRINRSFIKDFEMYLKNNCANGHNSAMKLLQILKKVYRIAVDNRWTSGNAFNGKHLSYKDVDIEVLTDTEIEALKQLEIQQGYLVKTRDILLFCIYTGQAYVDMQSVQRRHLVYNPETREYLIKKKREKTGVEYMLPLFHPARRQLGKWNTAWESAAPDTFLVPRISNQKFNNYIKELMALAGIQKKLASHSFRHTFATTITLENGVPIESVSRMMGHSKISETQRYGKVTAIKIERETKALFEKLSERKIG